MPSGTVAITNADERHGSTMVLNTKANVKKYGLKAMADYKCRLIENSFEGLQLILMEKMFGQELLVHSMRIIYLLFMLQQLNWGKTRWMF